MKTIIFSDTHLTTKFDQSKYDFLTRIISNVDRIIINGDFWDGYLISFSDFLNSKWSKLFPILKSKNTIYLFGNHDKEQQNIPQLTKLFCDKALKFIDIEIYNNIFHVEHGDRFFRNLSSIFPHIQQKIANLYYSIGTHIFKENFWKTYKNQNAKLNKLLTLEYPDHKIITSHTHLPTNIEDRFYNTGVINYGLAQYIQIDKQGIKMIRDRY